MEKVRDILSPHTKKAKSSNDNQPTTRAMQTSEDKPTSHAGAPTKSGISAGQPHIPISIPHHNQTKSDQCSREVAQNNPAFYVSTQWNVHYFNAAKAIADPGFDTVWAFNFFNTPIFPENPASFESQGGAEPEYFYKIAEHDNQYYRALWDTPYHQYATEERAMHLATAALGFDSHSLILTARPTVGLANFILLQILGFTGGAHWAITDTQLDTLSPLFVVRIGC